jgi:hypothetical protein
MDVSEKCKCIKWDNYEDKGEINSGILCYNSTNIVLDSFVLILSIFKIIRFRGNLLSFRNETSLKLVDSTKKVPFSSKWSWKNNYSHRRRVKFYRTQKFLRKHFYKHKYNRIASTWLTVSPKRSCPVLVESRFSWEQHDILWGNFTNMNVIRAAINSVSVIVTWFWKAIFWMHIQHHT